MGGRRAGRLLAWALGGAVVGVAIAVYLYLGGKQPVRSGRVSMPGLQAEVEVVFDRYGVPHIYATQEEDAYRALGYLHAQDRWFQIELLRRTANGQLSEVLGAGLVDTDRFMRTLRIARFAREYAATTLATSNPAMLAALDAYLAGVNHFVDSGPTPVEFDILGIPRREFEAADIVAIGGLMAYDFAYANRTDPLLTYIQSELGDAYLDDLAWSGKDEAPPRGASPLVSRLESVSGTLLRPKMNVSVHGRFGGSNGWVLSPAKTESGHVILTNDPHIGYRQPSVWHEAHLVAPGFELYGHHLAGVPFALLGHTRAHGWGLTMLKHDDMDFFVERVNPQNPNQVWFKDRWEDLTLDDETIDVGDGDDVRVQVRRSRHGPIINDAIEAVGSTHTAPVAMWWSYHDPTNRVLEGFYDLAHASSLDEARDGVRKMHAPGLNVLYGDRDGNIAWWTAARNPVRPSHVNSRFLLDGSSGADEFEGFQPFDENPQRVNPPEGFLVSANNRPVLGAGASLAGYFNIDDRFRRITALLERGGSFTSEDMRAMMLDTVSASAVRGTAAILSVLETSGAVGEVGDRSSDAMQLLRDWKGTHGPEEAAPSIYHELVAQILVATFEDELGSLLFDDFLRTEMMDWTIPHILERPEARWWDDVGTSDRKETRADVVVGGWSAAMATLEAELGSDPAGWQWGHLHTLEHVHAIGMRKPLNLIFNVGPFPAAGGPEVVNQQEFRYTPGMKQVVAGPSTRRVIDFADPAHTLGINPTGQSGHPFSDHYDDQADLFQAGRLRPQLMNRQEIVDDGRGMLMLVPER